MYDIAVRIKIHRTVHHRFKLAAYIFGKPAGFVFTIKPCRRSSAGIVKVSPILIVGLVSFLFCKIAEAHHLIKNIALAFLYNVRVFKGIIFSGA